MSARTAIHVTVSAVALLTLWPARVPAQSGTWSQAAAGTYNWGTAANWQGGTVANGANNTANFTTPGLTGPITVTLDTDRTIGSLVFDNPTNTFGWTVGGANTLTLSNVTTPSVAVNNPAITATIGVNLAGTQGLTTSGTGTLVLSAAGSYTGGTTVGNTSRLLVNNTTGSGTGTGPVTVSGGGGPVDGGTLGGTGSIAGPVTVNHGGQDFGTVAPGTTGVGTLALGSGLTLNGAYTADVTATPGNASDRIAITGNLTLGGTSMLFLPVSNTYAPTSAGVVYTLITFTGARTGTFGITQGVPAGYQVAYLPNAVILAVPEPAHLLLLCAAAAGVAWSRRRWR
jgi:fibronectin-binding autotransporter adhesin